MSRTSKPVARSAVVKRKRGQHGTVKIRPAGTLKDAVLQLVEANGGHVRAGEIAEVTKGSVQRWTDADGEAASVFPGVNKVRLLESACDDPHVTRFLAAEAGFALVRVSHAGEAVAALNMMAVSAGGEMGDVLRSVANAMADDGTIDGREAGAIIREIDEAMSALAAARAFAMQIRNGGRS